MFLVASRCWLSYTRKCYFVNFYYLWSLILECLGYGKTRPFVPPPYQEALWVIIEDAKLVISCKRKTAILKVDDTQIQYQNMDAPKLEAIRHNCKSLSCGDGK